MAEAKKDIYDFKEDIVLETNDVSKDLNSIAKEFNIDVSQLDFDIQNVKTFELDKETSNDWIELEGGLLKRLDEREHFSQDTLEIRQTYTVRFFLKDDYDDPFRDSVVHLSANKDFTTIYFIIEKGSQLHYRETLKRDMINLINKKKVLNYVFINIREKGFRYLIDEFIDKEIPVLEEDFVLKVAQGVPATSQVDDELIFVYKKEYEAPKDDDKGKVDHSKKGIVIPVAKDQLLIRYVKPQTGQEGRDCRGRILSIKPPVVENTPSFKVSENIDIVENNETIDYIAKKDGNIVFENETFDIVSHMEMGALSFKATGSINAGTDKDIELNVHEADALKDAVGMGVKVTVSNLNIEGNVGERAEITAHEVIIRGQTHQSSIIKATKVEVDIHKGNIFADKVKIKRLEAGIVEGEVVHIKEAIGGVIRAREVYIHNLFSHLKIYSSKKIDIENIEGSENNLIIDLQGYKDGVNEAEETQKNILETTQRIEYLQRVLKEELDEVLEIRKAFTLATKRLNFFEENEVEPPKLLIETLDEHQNFLENYKEQKEELKIKKEKLKDYEKKLDELQQVIFDAEVRVHGKWLGYNKIEFHLIEPKLVLEKITFEGCQDASFKLEKIMYEDQFEIVTQSLDELKNINK
jgi:hypothetical protein